MKWWLLSLPFILTFAVRGVESRHINDDRILDGKPADTKVYEYVRQLVGYSPNSRQIMGDDGKAHYTGTPILYGPLQCTASVISKRHILTAARCISFVEKNYDPLRLNDLIMIRGSLSDDANYKEHTAWEKSFVFPPKWHIPRGYNMLFEDKVAPYHDIAILELPEGADFGIPPITLAKDYQDGSDDKVLALGYGYYKYDKNTVSITPSKTNTLRSVDVKIKDLQDCMPPKEGNSEFRKKYDEMFLDETRLMCAGNGFSRAAGGDIGGPLIYTYEDKPYQIGVASYFEDIQITNKIDIPVVYTRISNHCDWITKVTNGEVTCVALNEPLKSTISPPDESAEDAEDSGDDNGDPQAMNASVATGFIGYAFFVWVLFASLFMGI